MNIEIFKEKFPDKIGKRISEIFHDAYGDPLGKDFYERALQKQNILLVTALVGENIVGFKLGYRKNFKTFFSWLGAVCPSFQRNGIGRMLLQRQHIICAEIGYSSIETTSNGKNMRMLILNLQEGFNVIGCQLGHKNELDVVLRKEIG